MARMGVYSEIGSSPAVLRALIAILLLVASGGDLAVDVACDPLPMTGGGLAVAAAAEGHADACASGCVPDCFCCSRSLGAGPRVEPPVPDGMTPTVVSLTPGLPPGHSLLAEHPPRARA